MLSKKVLGYLDDLVEMAEGRNYKLEANIFYNTYADLDAKDKTSDTLQEMQEYLNGKNIEIVSDGVEMEDDDESVAIDEKIRPFDPAKINITSEPMALDSLVKRLKNEEINLNTAFQRKAGLWSNKQKSQLIESLLLRIPLPAFYFDASDDGNWLVIDGLQRITAFNEFMVEKTLVLEGLEFFGALDGLDYDHLPRQFVRRIDESSIITYKVNESTPHNVKYNIFKRLNTGGLKLEPQEIRHALYQGAATELLKRLASSEAFLEATCQSIKTDRMLDQEFVLRFIAVCYYGIDQYDGFPDDFLNETMEYINQLEKKELAGIEAEFQTIMNTMCKIFGNSAFRKMAPDGRRRPINKAIYEIWCKGIYDLKENEREKAVESREHVIDRFVDLCQQYDFQTFVKSSDKNSYNRRMDMVQLLVKEAIR